MIKIAEELDISLETLLLEETKKDNEDLKVSIKYGVISFCLIFCHDDHNFVQSRLQQDYESFYSRKIRRTFNHRFKIIEHLCAASDHHWLRVLFYIFPKNKKRTNHFLGFDRNGRLEYRNQVMDRKTHFR